MEEYTLKLGQTRTVKFGGELVKKITYLDAVYIVDKNGEVIGKVRNLHWVSQHGKFFTFACEDTSKREVTQVSDTVQGSERGSDPTMGHGSQRAS